MGTLLVMAAAWAAPRLAAQPVLARTPISTSTTCGIQTEVKSVAIQPGNGIVIALLADTIRPDDWPRLREEVASFYQAARDKEAVRVALILSGGVRVVGPFPAATSVRAALDDMARPVPGFPRAITPAAFYTQIGAPGSGMASRLGADWSAAILVGRFPDVPAAVLTYTQAWVAGGLRSAKLRVYYWQMSGANSAVLDAAVRTTGGLRLSNGLADAADVVGARLEFQDVSWQNPAMKAGFRLCATTLGGPGGEMAPFPTIIGASAGSDAPSIERYGVLQEKIRAVNEALRQPQLTEQQVRQADADLTAALAVNSHEEEALRLGVTLYKKSANDAKLAATLEGLTELAPEDAALFGELGRARYRLRDWAAAESALLRARALTPLDATLAEDLARVHLQRSDDRGALPFLEARLGLGAPSQELWLVRADIASRLEDWERETDSIEHALALGTLPLDRRTALIRLYIEHQQPAKALVHVRAVAETLPRDGAIREQYARFIDELQPSESMAVWKRTLEADSRSELAHYRITQILIEQNALNDALQAAEAGIEAAPGSARLYVAKSQILERLHQYYAARATLRRAAESLPEPDAPLLARLAEMEDAGGVDAARHYQRLVEVLEKTSQSSTGRSDALQRGLDAALRDADLERAKWFQTRLSSGASTVDGPPAWTRGGTVVIPGGLNALSFIARSRASLPDRFLVDYARTVARNTSVADKKAAEAYISGVREYFRRVGELAAMGMRHGDRVTVTLDVADRAGQRNTEKALDLLGWRMQTNRDGVKIEPVEKGSKAARQETASALAINEIGMQEALQAGKPFSFEIPYEPAAAVLGEELWRTQFYPNANYPGGLAEAIVNDLELAETYAGLGQMDGATAAALISGSDLKRLADQNAEQLMRYSSAMAVDRGKVALPGGSAAAQMWSNLAHANPDQPAAFFRALLGRDDGELLAYYAALSALDIRHQRFFTRTPARLTSFYELFRDAPETQRSASRRIQAGPFAEFLAEVPLNRDGNLDFPGSPEVWMVAKGQAGPVDKMIKKVQRSAAPDVEDQILLRLARTRYKKDGLVQGELDNFLAVAQIDAHRAEPLDQASALYLAQHFDNEGAMYPYFSALTGLKEIQFREFFELSDAMQTLEGLERNAALGTFHSLVKIVSLAQQAGALDENQAAELFGKIVERFMKVSSPAARTIASVDLLRDILTLTEKQAAEQAAKPDKSDKSDPDTAMRLALLGTYAPVEVRIGGAVTMVDASKVRHAQYRQVLELQKVPSLAMVFALFDALQGLAAGKSNPAELIQIIDSKSPGLLRVEVPKTMHAKDVEREMIEGFDRKRLQDIVKDLRSKVAKKKVNPKDLAKLAQDYLAEINAPVRWALEGVVYAYYLSPEDLLVSEDPLLLRKHRFANLAPLGKQKLVLHEPADVTTSSEGIGSYFTGGFANFGDAAGKAAAQSAKLGGGYGEALASKQMAALRETDWGKLRDEDLRWFGLRVTVAREWIARAAGQPELEASLAEATLGLLSLTRRANLIAALAERDWGTVWNCVTLSDLYFLGGRYQERYATDPWQSPATQALRAMHGIGAKLGAETQIPYEDREKEVLPDKIAERSAEFNLYLARFADGAGIPAASLGAMAEPAARAMLKRMQLADVYDWRSALAAYAELDGKILLEALGSAAK